MKAGGHQKLGDPELVGLCLEGDQAAWETLIERYRRLIYSIPNKFGFSQSDCNDVFQTVCVKLIEHLSDLKDETKVSAWLITTTTRHCIHVQTLGRRDVSDADGMEEAPDPTVSMEQIRVVSDRQQKVRDTIAEMPERCRRLLSLLYLDSKSPSYEEISVKMSMPVPSIGPTRARCLDKLRRLLRRKGIQ